MPTQFWTNDMTILFNNEHILELWPYKSMTYEEQLNATTRFIILVSLFGFMILNNYLVILMGVILVLVIITIYSSSNKRDKENMDNLNSIGENESGKLNAIPQNPFQNVMLTHYTDDVNKPEVTEKYSPSMEEEINEKTKEFIFENNKDNADIHKAFNSLGNELEFEKSMRQFYINPSTSIPNTQDDFLEFCYKSLPSEKPLNIY